MHDFSSAFSVLLTLIAVGVHAQEFTKVSNEGVILPDSAALGDGPQDWACTRDNKTGLMWEVKTSSGLRDLRHNYTWRSGGTGNVGNTASCANTLAPARCNTDAYAARINNEALCGSSRWRLPGGSYRGGPAGNSPNGELAVLYQNAFATTGVNFADWFPNTRGFWHWTNTQDRFNFGRVWAVRFDSGQVFSNFWNFDYPIRLVTIDQPAEPPQPPPPPPEPEIPPVAGEPDLENVDPVFGDEFELISRQDFNAFVPEAFRDWKSINLSEPRGENSWTRGDDTLFESLDGASNDYWAIDFTAVEGVGTISAWSLSPVVEFQPGSKISFFTRALDSATFPDRLEIRACITGSCDSFTVDEFSVSDFDIPIASINPDLLPGLDPQGATGFPDRWTRFEFGASRGVPQSGTGRIAFRYFVTDGGPEGQNSFYVGLDDVRIHATPTNPPGIWDFTLIPESVESGSSVVVYYSTARASGCQATGDGVIVDNTEWNGGQSTGTDQLKLLTTEEVEPGSYTIALRCFNRRGEETTAEAVLTVTE